MDTSKLRKVIDKVSTLGETLSNNDIESMAKSDIEQLQIGIRKDGGPQIAARKKEHFKSTDMDLGKYMSHGLSVDTQKLSIKKGHY
jgi:hypothetical protein